MREIREQPRLNALFGALDIASEHIRRARRAEIKAIFIAVFVMVAEDEIIQLIFRRHILQPAHILRKILAFKSCVNLNLIPITPGQLSNAVQVLAQLQNAHAHAGMGKPVLIRPRHMVRKPQLIKPLPNGGANILLVRSQACPHRDVCV